MIKLFYLFTSRKMRLAGLALFDGLNNRRVFYSHNSIMLKFFFRKINHK
jgi:hypothetical protein